MPTPPDAGVEVVLPSGRTVTAPNGTAATAVRAAVGCVGMPYTWGGTDLDAGVDSSGLTYAAYERAGLEIPRLAREQTIGAEVPSADEAEAGDLIVWDGHVAMCVGRNGLVEAAGRVRIGAMRVHDAYGRAFLGIYRPTG